MTTHARSAHLLRLICWLKLALFASLGASSSIAQSIGSAAPIESRAREFAQAVNSSDATQLKALVATSFGENLQKIPMPSHIAVLMAYWDISRGLSLLELQNHRGSQAVALFKNTLTGGITPIWFEVEPKPPHKIVGIGPGTANAANIPARKLTSDEIARELGTFMSRLAEADTFSGVVLLAKDGQVVFQSAYGLADKNFSVPARLDTKYNLGSMGKMFTAVAIAQLVERGALSYDDPLSKFLPEFPNPESAQKIRIKHLLSHSAGLGMWWGPRYFSSAKDQFRSVDDLLNWAATDEKTLAFEPGAKFQYSNTGYVVLGKVIEVVTGKRYFDYVRENIYKPAGMTSTHFYENEPIDQHLAIGYERRFDATGRVMFRSNVHLQATPLRGSPAGGAFSTIGDLLKFSQVLRTGKLLQSNSMQLLMSSKPEFHSDRYGYGFDVSDTRHTAGHAGGGMGTSDNFEMFLDSGWTAIVLANYTMVGFEVSSPVVEKMRELVGSR